MGDSNKKRWSVTYTKHITQKRKVYQDGFLHFHTHTNKVELFDDCLKLLGVKIAQKDDVISSGEALTFNSYLVDIGDLEGYSKPMSNLNGQVQDDNKVTEKKAELLRPKKKFNPVFAGIGKANYERNKAPSSCPGPSPEIITEFKKNEMLKYGGPRNSPDAAKVSTAEWQVLYTSQKTQKAKKYHDGFLRVATCGFQGRQATLYDITRRVLDSKFLKKDEVIECGKSLVFDGHLIDVGEPESNQNPPSDLKAQEKSSSTGGKTELSQRQHAVNVNCSENEHLALSDSTPQLNGLTAAKYTRREWHALYTNQITQKAKKYQSGFLTLAACGSFQLQATLLTEDGTVLSRKFLELSEDVKKGTSFQLPNYLVEVGEPRESPEGEPPKPSLTVRPSVVNSEPGKSNPVDKLINGEGIPRNALSGRKGNSMLYPSIHCEPGKNDPIDHKPLRGGEPSNAWSRRELKSTLRPIGDRSEQENSDPVDKPLRGAYDILSILRNSTNKQNSLPTESISLEQHGRSHLLDYVHSLSQNHTKSNVRDSAFKRHGAGNHTMGILNSDSEAPGVSQCKYSSPPTFFMGEEVDYLSVSNSDGEQTSMNIPKPLCCANNPQVKVEPQNPLPLDKGSNGYTEAFIKSMFSKDEETLSYELPEEMNTKPFVQPDVGNKMDTEKTSAEGCNYMSKMDDIPSFDLGF